MPLRQHLKCLLAGVLAASAEGSTASAETDYSVDKQSFASSAQVAQLARSERLRMFVWGKWIETGQAPREIVDAMRSGLTRQGFYHDADTPKIILLDSSAGPTLAYDRNINGGLAQDSFSLGGLVFDADPDLLAIPGIVLGLGAGGVGRLALSRGSYLEATVSSAAGWAPASTLGVFDGSVQLCARDHLVRWNFLDACLVQGWSARDLTNQSITRGSMALSTIFETDHGWHEVSGQLARTEFDEYAQITTTLGIESVWDRVVTETSVTLGVPVEGTTALAHRMALDVHWLMARQPVSLSLWRVTARGGSFLGTSREDQSIGLTYQWQASGGPLVEIGVTRRDSTVDIFDQVDASFRLRFDGFGL